MERTLFSSYGVCLSFIEIEFSLVGSTAGKFLKVSILTYTAMYNYLCTFS